MWGISRVVGYNVGVMNVVGWWVVAVDVGLLMLVLGGWYGTWSLPHSLLSWNWIKRWWYVAFFFSKIFFSPWLL